MVYFGSRFPFTTIMHTNFIHRCVVGFFLGLVAASVSLGDPFFHETDPLAPRDEWGLLHQTPNLNHTDFFPRHGHRIYYNFKAGYELLRDPAYVAALQGCLRRRSYYCGPIDGIMSDEVTDAIAKCQKNHAQRVTGRLTVAVRRVLRLP